jgi:alpha-L-arabinofuranosidase
VYLPVLVTLTALASARAEDATIRVDATKTVARVTRHMTGVCLEDVNHEVYGGLYAQMVFGESFQESPAPPPVKGFRAYGGQWEVADGVASVRAGPGPKLISDHPAVGDGEIGVEVFLPGRARGVAGLILAVRDPKVGMDTFTGYEVSVSNEPGFVLLGRHRQNWEPIKTVPHAVPADRWVSLAVRRSGNTVEILVDGKSVLTHEDRDHPLAPGAVGLRPFDRAARFRNLSVRVGDKTTPLPLVAEPRWDAGVSGMWTGVRVGTAAGSFAIETKDLFIGKQSQRITFERGEGAIGVENRGLNRWGLAFAAGKPYEGYLWARAEKEAELVVALENGNGQVTYARTRLKVPAGTWAKHEFALTPDGTAANGRLVLLLDKPGSVVLGHAFLQPGEWGRYKGLPVRKDVAEALVDGGLTVLRYGGSMVNAPGYKWKNMIGPRDRRPPYPGFWYPHSTNGWGVPDFLAFCEAAGFLAIPAFNPDETPQDMADFVEYANGPADSPWGKKRAADGHPAPFRLKYLEVGNEEAVDDAYFQKFKAIADAVWPKDPDVTLVVGDFAYNGRITDPFNFPGAPRIKSLAAHQKILELAKAARRAVWFDVHVWNDNPRDPDQLGGGIIGLKDFGAALAMLVPGAEFKVAVFEENSGNHAMRRALAHAHAVNELERLGDLAPVVCCANALQPVQQNDNGWDQGLVFLSPDRVWGQPPYYVTRMLARHYLPRVVSAEVTSPGGALDVTAKADEKGTVLQLQVVNLDAKPVAAALRVNGLTPTRPTARVVELAGKLADVNTAAEPRKVAPADREWRPDFKDGAAGYTFPPHSFTIIRLE